MPAPHKIGLVQINNSFSGQNYFPYSVGILQGYAQKHLKHPENYEFLLPVYSRQPVAKSVEQLLDAELVAFSAYVWNFKISIAIAQELKKRKPEIVIVFGGPHVPDRVEGFLRQYRFIDLACHSEGERPFTAVLEALPERRWEGLGSVSYIRPDGALVTGQRLPRIDNLMDVPSPYLDGVFTPLMKARPEEQWIGMWETNRGCPFSCTFCDWGSATAAKVSRFEMERLHQELDWFAGHKIQFIFCADANFGMLPRDVDLTRYAAEVKKRTGYPHAISVQNTKNATERAYEVQKILNDAGMNKGVTISLQTMDAPTLENIKRDNISMDTYQTLQKRFASQGVSTYSDVILALPGETYDTLADGVHEIIRNGQHNRIQFNNLSILPNAEMGDPAYIQKYGMLTVTSDIINVHGATSEKEEIVEEQELVIGTASMPKPEWVRTRAFCWWTGLLYFDKLLQIPFLLLNQATGSSFRELIELFSEGDLTGAPNIAKLKRFFLDEAASIQNGGPEYCRGERWLNIWWPADEYALIELCFDGKLEEFYREAESLLERHLAAKGKPLAPGQLAEAMRLNRSLLKRPFIDTDLEIELEWNLLEFYHGACRLAPVALRRDPRKHLINRTKDRWSSWDDWCREVIWWGNKKGAYLYGATVTAEEREIAGHY